jgi:DnaK suppressor protein
MKKSEREYFRTLLLEWQEQLMERADHAIAGLLDTSVYASDLLDRVALETDRDLALRMRDRESKLIRKIKGALKRIDDGSFGICDICGDEITLNRLRVRPITTYCIDCKRVQETLERIIGC